MGRGVNADDGCDQGDGCEEDQQEPDSELYHNSVLSSFFLSVLANL